MKNIRNNKHLSSIVTMAMKNAMAVKIATAIIIVLAGFETTVMETKAADFEKAEACVEIRDESSPKEGTISYTFTDMEETTMYAKSAVNVRSLPSKKGTRLGSLAKDQAVIVTGKCNETGWYRIKYNDGESYVSNKYLSETTVADTNVADTNAGGNVSANSSITDPAIAAAIEKYGPDIIIFDDGMILDAYTWEWLNKPADGFDKEAAEQVWAYMNAERTAAGLNEIEWDEDIYNFACQRAQAIVTNFSHEGHGCYGENIEMYSNGVGDVDYIDDAYEIHMVWHNSPGHYRNYMTSRYKKGACAVYVYDGFYYAVENFIS